MDKLDALQHARIIFDCAGKSPGMIEHSLRQNIESKPSDQTSYWESVLAHFLALSDKAHAVPQEETGYDEA